MSDGSSSWPYLWDDAVHKRFNESLSYYLVRFRGFNLGNAIENLEKLFHERDLGSVRVFPIHGAYDLLIRAWLHPNLLTRFRQWVQELPGYFDMATFSVTDVEQRWFSENRTTTGNGSEYSLLLENLNDTNVPDVQEGRDPDLQGKLLQASLLQDWKDTPSKTIRFFIAVDLDLQAVEAGVVKDIRAYLATERNRETFSRVSIYRGFGFCSIFIKAQVHDYFDIPSLPLWIGKNFSSYGASTQTLLAHGPDQILGNEKIGQATFSEIGGKDLFVQLIIPELYTIYARSPKRPDIEETLKQAHARHLTRQVSAADKKLLRDYFLGYLLDDVSMMSRTMAFFFVELETYLRGNYLEFIGRLGLSIQALSERANIPKDKKLTLHDLLNLCGIAAKNLQTVPSVKVDFASLSDLRNQVAHGDLDFRKHWKEALETLLSRLTGVRQLLEAISELTQHPYTGSY